VFCCIITVSCHPFLVKSIKPLRTRELNLLKEFTITNIESKRKQINLLIKEIKFRRIKEYEK